METTINERIRMIIENSGMNITAFAKKIGISQTSLRDCVVNESEPRYGTLYKIIKAEPLISTSWLLTGEGNMLLDGEKEKREDKSQNIEATLQIHLKGSRSGNGFSLSFSGGTLDIEAK